MTQKPWNEPGTRFDKALEEEVPPVPSVVPPVRCSCCGDSKCPKRLAGECKCHAGGDDDQ